MSALRALITTVLGIATLAASLGVQAQDVRKLPRVGVLMLTPRESIGGVYVRALRQGLSDLGYEDGRTIIFDVRWAEARADRLGGLARDLVTAGSDVIVTSGTEAIRAARQASSSVPIIMATVTDPVALGFAAHLARPGANLTGLAILSPELTAKRLQLFREAVPSATRIGVIWNPANEANALMLRELQKASQTLGVDAQAIAVRGADELTAAFATFREQGVQGVIMFEDSMLVSHTGQIVRLAASNRLPAMYPFRSLVTAGGLMSYGPDLPDMFRRSAAYVDRVLKGSKPADLPIEQPTKFELVINLKTANGLRMTLPQSILIRADEILQ